MVHEVVQGILLPLDVVVRDDTIFEFGVIHMVTIFINGPLFALITAASENREEKEDWDSGNDEDHVLEDVHEQVGVELAGT